MHSSARSLRVGITVAAVLFQIAAIGCRRAAVPSSAGVEATAQLPAGAAEAPVARRAPNGGRDPQTGDIARRVPGFAGMYTDDAGDFNVLLTARGDEAVARRELDAWRRENVRQRYGPERAASMQLSIEVLPTGTNGSTSSAPIRGCCPSCRVRSIRSTATRAAFSEARTTASASPR